jgi:dihydropteroate synthase
MVKASGADARTGGWKTARFVLEWPVWAQTGHQRPLLMGVLNITPDSFSDGGRFSTIDTALRHARQLLDEGADILDIGAESTRPGAHAVDAASEWARLQPVLTELSGWGVPLSLDTMKPEVMRRGVDIGVDILNDVSGFTNPEAQGVLRASEAAAVIMHMQGEPRTMQHAPQYDDCVTQVGDFLSRQIEHLNAMGVGANRLLVDPGFGFGKTLQHNIELFMAIDRFAAMGAGVLVGVSRKSMIGALTQQTEASLRVYGSVAAAVRAADLGARVLRVHDVRATRDALQVADALRNT